MFVYGSKTQDFKKRFSENVIEYLYHSKNGMAKCGSTQKLFQRFYILRYSKIKKCWCIVNHRNKWYFVIDSQVCQKFRSDYNSDLKKK